MRSKAGMTNRQGDVDLPFSQVSAPQLALWLGHNGKRCLVWSAEQGLELERERRESVAVMYDGEMNIFVTKEGDVLSYWCSHKVFLLCPFRPIHYSPTILQLDAAL
jgi:hypothetical protein